MVLPRGDVPTTAPFAEVLLTAVGPAATWKPASCKRLPRRIELQPGHAGHLAARSAVDVARVDGRQGDRAEVVGDRLHRREPGAGRLGATEEVAVTARAQWVRAQPRGWGSRRRRSSRRRTVGEPDERRRPMGFGGPGLAGHRQLPPAGRAAADAVPLEVVLAERVGQGVGQASGDHLLAGGRLRGTSAALAVDDRVDRSRWAPLAARGQGRGDIRQFERIESNGPRVKDPMFWRLMQSARLSSFGRRPGRCPVRRRTASRAAPPCPPLASTPILEKFGERGVRGLGQGVGDVHAAAVAGGVLHAAGRRRASGGRRCRPARARRTRPGTSRLALMPEPHLQRRGGGEDLEDRSGAVRRPGR